MKKLNLKGLLSLRSFALVGIFAIALFFASCNKDEDGYIPASFESEDLKSGKAVKKGDMSIAEIALADDGEFDELVAALLYVDGELNAGLVNLFLNGTEQYTVFAPTDAAFEALYTATGASEISDLPADLVLNVLLYHVTEGRRAANSVVPKMGMRTITTLLEGATFTVNTGAMITAGSNTANIVTANVSASNGIIHVIDTVILP